MSATTELTEEKVLETLRGVKFPGLSRDIVSFGFIKDLEIGEGAHWSTIKEALYVPPSR